MYFNKNPDKMKIQLALGLLLAASCQLAAQTDLSRVIENTNVAVLDSLAAVWAVEAREAKAAAEAAARLNNWPLRLEKPEGGVMELMRLDEQGNPLYYTTNNVQAAISTRTNLLYASPYNVTGSNMIVGEWDGGAVRLTHEQLSGRVTQVDGATSISDHATHVAGTLIGDGTGSAAVASSAKGMAYAGTLRAHDWNNDDAEMSAAAAAGLLISNHSYGYIGGHNYDSGSSYTWYGGSAQFTSGGEEPRFGKYIQEARNWDDISFNAPNYLIVKSAGNDRNDNPGGSSLVRNGTSGSYVAYNSSLHPMGDGVVNSGYDNIMDGGNAKNVLTVGAVNDVSSYTGPSSVVMSSFSSWGPTDDGRIKPDICGNGVNLLSSIGSGDSDYSSYSGTSMASPNVAGTALLLQQHYQNTHGSGNFMRAATLKGLIIHTADEAGDHPGPDYRFGWGLMNAERAAQVISLDTSNALAIQEAVLANNSTFSMQVVSNGQEPLAITLSWTDPAGSTDNSSTVDNPAIKLVNDLDLRLSSGNTVYFPYILDPANPAAAAATGDNTRDNAEKIYPGVIPAGTYTLTVSHKGSLSGNSQAFSLIVTGSTAQPPGGSISNPSACQLNLSIPDNSCSSSNQFFINVATAPGNQLGKNVFLKEVKLIIAHTYASDLGIRLRSPSGAVVELSNGNGASGDNYGNPGDASCQSVTRFTMGAPTSITEGSAPFIGSYKPEGDLYSFLDGSNPVGSWMLEICDGFPADEGMLKFVELVFSPNLPNPSPCQLNLPIPDNSCSAANRFPIEVDDAPGNQLGTNVFLKEVRLIAEHTWTADLDISLISPSGITVELSSDNGGDGDNYGNPSVVSCGAFTSFSMSASTPITAGSAPFVGSFVPEGSFSNFNNGSSPLGTWQIQLCDDESADAGILRYVELVFCPSVLWYADADGDGYGNPVVSVASCENQPGYVGNNSDCDDADAAVNPGATEVCNDIDDDCDGQVDEDLPLSTWHPDADGDGYGSPAGLIYLACSAPPGYASNTLDCNDSNAAVYPGAAEVCNGIDDDCDGQVDEGLQSAWYLDADSDGYGHYTTLVYACDQPQGYAANNSDCDDSNPAIPGPVEICNGLDDDCNGFAEAATNTWTGNGDGIDWMSPLNWSDYTVPLPCQDIVVPAGKTVVVPAGAVVFGRTLTVDPAAELIVNLTAVMNIKQD